MLIDNPFFILGVTSRDGKDVIAEAFEDCAADEDYEESVLMQAQKNLLTSKARLNAEISWFPDLAPKRASEIVDILKKMKDAKPAAAKRLQEYLFEIAQDLSGVSQANLASHLCASQTGDIDTLNMLVQAQQDIAAETIKNAGPVSSDPKSSEQFGWLDSRSIEKRV